MSAAAQPAPRLADRMAGVLAYAPTLGLLAGGLVLWELGIPAR